MSVANPLQGLAPLGQSAWLDHLRREWVEGDRMARFITEDDVRGVTSNPSIFQAAVADSSAYDAQIAELVAEGLSVEEIYDRLTLDDIRATCDIFMPLYTATDGLDGYVSHEVSPRLAYDTEGTIAEAHRLWRAVDRPNVMIKIPATKDGIPAITRCLRDGININVTLMFSMSHYDAVAESFLMALEERLAYGEPVDRIASVASFFVSRVDSKVDAALETLLGGGPEGVDRGGDGGGDERRGAVLAELRGQAAVANAKRAWRRSQHVFSNSRFDRLARRGARPQRVLWASTSTKDPAYSDVLYVDALIGPDSVNTLPLNTLEAFRDHGTAARTIDVGLDEADEVVSRLCALDIDLVEIGETLSREGVESFARALDGVLETVRLKVEAVRDSGGV